MLKNPQDASSRCRTVWHHGCPQHSAGALTGIGPCVPTSGGGAAWAARIGPVSPTSDRGIDHAIRLALAAPEARAHQPVREDYNEHEIEFLGEAGYQVVHDLGLGLTGGGDEYLRITPRQWADLTVEHRRAEADGYFLSCTATSMIDAIEEVERRLDRPVVNSNQAVLWAALRRLEITEPIGGLGRLFRTETSGRPQLPDR